MTLRRFFPTPKIGADNGATSITITAGRWRSAARASARVWLILITSAAFLDLIVSAIITIPNIDRQSLDGIVFNVAALSLGIAISVLVGLFAPQVWYRVIVAALLLPTLALAITSSNSTAAFTIIILLATFCWFGRAITGMIYRECETIEAWTLGSALGIALIATTGLLFGTIGRLNTVSLWPLCLALLAILVLCRRSEIVADIAELHTWSRHSTERDWLKFIVAGITIACLWLNFIGALAPEIYTDAIRQRLVTAVRFAHQGNLVLNDPDLAVANDPALGEITYAVAIAMGSIQTAKLFHWLTGVLCALAVFTIGRRLSGVYAGGLAGAIFYCTLVVAYLSQTAYLDLLTTLFALAAVLALLIGSQLNSRLVALSGILLGAGVAVKLHFVYVAVGVALLALLILGQGSRKRIIPMMGILISVAGLTVTPWLVRSYLITGVVPGLALVSATASNLTSAAATPLGDLNDFGYGRSLLNLITLPFTVTFSSAHFGGLQMVSGLLGGHIGFAALGFVPLALFIRGRHLTIPLLISTAVASLGWFYTAQYLRYGLPMFALLCCVAGGAYTAVYEQESRQGRIIFRSIFGTLIILGVIARVQMPDTAHRLAFGLENRDSYLAQWLGRDGAGNYEVLQLINADPTATRVLTMYDGARLYTDIRLTQPWMQGVDLYTHDSEENVLANLERGGFSHILIDRSAWWSDRWVRDGITVIDEDFLRRNTRLVGGSNSCYLYRILPPEQRDQETWTQGPELLIGGGFTDPDTIRQAGWATTGTLLFDYSEAHMNKDIGAVQLSEHGTIASTVEIKPESTYLFSLTARGVAQNGTVQLRIEWLDRNGAIMQTAIEQVPTNVQTYRRFSMLATAPTGSTAATVSAMAQAEQQWVDNVSFGVFSGTK
jgi:4-amino-4-deoxy-L-arabinose transferase-like glycosyltransferase